MAERAFELRSYLVKRQIIGTLKAGYPLKNKNTLKSSHDLA